MDLKETGVFIAGLVVQRNKFQAEGKKDRHTIDVLVAGHKELFSVSLPDTLPIPFVEKLVAGSIAKLKVRVNVWKGNTYYEALAA